MLHHTRRHRRDLEEGDERCAEGPAADDEECPGAARPRIPTEIHIMVAAAFIIAMGYGLIAPILPQFATSFDVSIAAAGAVVSVFALSRLCFAPASGRLVDALGQRRVYLAGLSIVAVTTGAIGLAGAYWHVFALRAAAGVGSTMFTVSAMALVVKLSPPAIRGRCQAAYSSAFLLGNIVGPVAGAALSGLGMRWPFLIYGAVVALSVAVVWWAMPATVGAAPRRGAGPAEAPMTVREALSNPSYRGVLASAFAHGWANLGMRVALLPLFAAAIFEHDGAIAGLALAAFALGNAACLQFSGRASDRFGRKPLIVAGLLINGVFTVFLGLSDSAGALIASSVLAGCGVGLFNPSHQALVADVIGERESGSRVLAAFQMTQDAGSIAGPVVGGALAGALGFTWAFAISGVLVLLAAVQWLPRPDTLRPRLAPAAA